MTGEDFVAAIKRSVRDSAIQDCRALLEKPPGRRPAQALVAQSNWYLSLSAHDQRRLAGVIQEAVDTALFGFFCVLDGVRAVEDGPIKGDFVLNYVKDTSTPLNGPALPCLHDLFMELIAEDPTDL
jgi:hypothetical protein